MKAFIGILIILASIALGFLIGGAQTAAQFSESYDSIKADLDRMYDGQCGRVESPKKVYPIKIIYPKEGV